MRVLQWAIALTAGLVLWAAEAAAGIVIRVNKTTQTMQVVVDGQHRYTWAVSTGREGYNTPNGSYTPQRLERHWQSRRYGMAPMPHSIFFRGGYAIHGTNMVRRLGQIDSHGCIRLAPGHARILFEMVQRRRHATRIVIEGQPPMRSLPRYASRHADLQLASTSGHSPLEMRRRAMEERYLVTVRRLGRNHAHPAARRHAGYYPRSYRAPAYRYSARPAYYQPRYAQPQYVLPYFAQPPVHARPLRPSIYGSPYVSHSQGYRAYREPRPVYRTAPQRNFYDQYGGASYVAPQPRVIYGTPGWDQRTGRFYRQQDPVVITAPRGDGYYGLPARRPAYQERSPHYDGGYRSHAPIYGNGGYRSRQGWDDGYGPRHRGEAWR